MRTGRPRIDLSAYTHLFGVVPDREIAKLAGCTDQTVRNHRARYPNQSTPHAPPGRPTLDLSRYTHLMGVLSDSEIAKVAGCHRRTIYRHRRSLGIPSIRLLSPFRRLRWAFGRLPDIIIARLARLPRKKWGNATAYAIAVGCPTRRLKGWPGFTFRRSREAL